MKIRITGILVLVILISCSSQNSINTSEKKTDQMTKTKTEIQLELNAEFSISVGYGNIYDCQVLSTKDTFFTEKEIKLIFLAGNEAELILNDNLKPNKVRATFRKTEEIESKKIAPINGFVDENMVVWELISLTAQEE